MDPYLRHLKWIDAEKENLATTLEAWANIHSGSNNLAGLERMVQELKAAFAPLEGNIKEVPLKSCKVLNIKGDLDEQVLGKALSVVKRPKAPVRVLLAGHMDIAHAAGLPLEPCKRNGEDRLCGRGTADMKGGLLVMIMALKALEMSPLAEMIGWEVILNPDEEIGSPGSADVLAQAAKRHHVGLIFEPAFSDGWLVSERKGSANFTLAASGKAAHAGRDFHLGHNALTDAARFALAAEGLIRQEEGITVNIGSLEGGGAVNIVPDRALCRFNIRVNKTGDLHKVHQKLEQIASRENEKPGVSLHLYKEVERAPKIFDAKTQKLFEALKSCGKELGIDVQWRGSGGVCDGNIFAGVGLPCIDTLGPVGGFLHTADEYVVISSMVQRAKLAARLLMQLAAKEIVMESTT